MIWQQRGGPVFYSNKRSLPEASVWKTAADMANSVPLRWRLKYCARGGPHWSFASFFAARHGSTTSAWCSPHVASTLVQALEAIGKSWRHRDHADASGTHEYQLSPAGEELRPIVMSMGFWGHRWVESRLSLKNLDPSLLMWDMRRNLNPQPLPPRPLHDSVSVPRIARSAEKLVAGGRKRRRRPMRFRPWLRGRPLGARLAQIYDGSMDGHGGGGPGDRCWAIGTRRRAVDRQRHAEMAGSQRFCRWFAAGCLIFTPCGTEYRLAHAMAIAQGYSAP